MEMDLRLNGDPIPYNPNPVFLGITLDEGLFFKSILKAFWKSSGEGLNPSPR